MKHFTHRMIMNTSRWYIRFSAFLLLILVLGLAPSTAQDAKIPQNPAVPTVVFDLYWEAATPQNYTITVDASRKARYVSRNPTRTNENDQSADPEYQIDFTISEANQQRIFQLAKTANYFHGDFDFEHPVANTGK